jgi:hypothetical protein
MALMLARIAQLCAFLLLCIQTAAALPQTQHPIPPWQVYGFESFLPRSNLQGIL